MRNRTFGRRLSGQATHHAFVACTLFVAAGFTSIAKAQSQPSAALSSRTTQSALLQAEASLDLPDAPGEVRANSSAYTPVSAESQASSSGLSSTVATGPDATPTDHCIQPGQHAPSLMAHDKAVMGLEGAFSWFAAIGWVSAAGYEQLTNTSPNYGTDRGAFGQRLGASAIRAISEDVLADSVLAPAFHEDPRYYRLGSSHKFLPRLAYAATRAIITRSDSGRTVPNFSQIGGNLIGAALTNAYYPQSNRTAVQTLETFGGSLGGTALGDGITEFFGGFLFDRHHVAH